MKSYTSKGDLAARAVLNKLDFDGNKARTAFFLLKIGDGPPVTSSSLSPSIDCSID